MKIFFKMEMKGQLKIREKVLMHTLHQNCLCHVTEERLFVDSCFVYTFVINILDVTWSVSFFDFYFFLF